MNEQKKDKKNMVYAMIGIMTLIISTMGATFAYYTYTTGDNNVITGNMASITFNLAVAKVTTVDDTKGGLIPMSNTMVESAVTSSNGICVDDNNNAVCQIYRINVENTGTANMFLDGYVTLTGGSGVPTDYPDGYTATAKTTMRWAQVFCDEETVGTLSNCTTVGTTTTSATKSDNGVAAGITSNWSEIEKTNTEDTTGYNKAQILTSGVTTKATINGNDYDVINTNYIRISDHSTTGYTQSGDITSALVYNEQLDAKNDTTNPTGGSSSTYTDSQIYYIVVWLSETGTNQTAGSGLTNVPTATTGFFNGTVAFISAQGSEVTATFSGWTSVAPDTQ